MSQDRAIALQPGQQSEILSQRKKGKKEKVQRLFPFPSISNLIPPDPQSHCQACL